jgi:hypothetical protein
MKIFAKTLAVLISLAAGRLAQLVEHLVYTERVGGSSPSPPTSAPNANRKRLAIAVALAAFLISAGSFAQMGSAWAQGAPMSFHLARVSEGDCTRDCPQIIVAEGVIEEDTPQAFIDFVRSAATQRGARGVVLLSSPGGRVVASMRLGAALRKMRAAVIVARSWREGDRDLTLAGPCMSACVYAMMGGVKRIVPAQSSVGIHRMSREDASESWARAPHSTTRSYASSDMVKALADYAAEMGVNPAVIRTAEGISPEEIHILSPAELQRWRVASPRF